MTFFTRIAVLFYVTLVLFISCFMLLFILNQVNLADVTTTMHVIYHDETLKMVFGILVGVFLLVNFIFYRTFNVNVHRDKIIAFDNPEGRVTVSLMALEDLVKRKVMEMQEVKGLKSSIKASKKGLKINIKLSLNSEVNIPHISSRVQEQVKRKVQDMIGLDEPIDVTIYVGKISAEKSRKLPKDHKVNDKQLEQAPLHGYGA